MAKPRKKDFSVSLFPFLSILACVLGVLTLMITSVVLTQIDDESVEQARQEVVDKNLREAEETREKIKLEKQWIEDVKKRIESSRKVVAKARVLKDLVTQVEAMKKKEKPGVMTEAQMKKEIASLKSKTQEMKKKIAAMETEVPRMEQELAKRGKPSDYATVNVRPSGSGFGEMINPVFIECTINGLVLFDAKGKESLKVPTANITKDPKLKKAIQEISKKPGLRIWKSRQGTKMEAALVDRYPGVIVLRKRNGETLKFNPNLLTLKCQEHLAQMVKAKEEKKKPSTGHYVIFLVRPDGVKAWGAARNFCWANNCKNGKLPIASKGPINLKPFLN